MRRNSSSTSAADGWPQRLLKVGLVNVIVLLLLLIPVELIFGGWIRGRGIDELKRFSIPIGISYEYDVSGHYASDIGTRIRYSRDKWGLRGSYRSVADVRLVTVGGSTTDQKYLDDSETWQSFTERELARLGRPLVIANAGVDGQSTAGHLFTLRNWLPHVADLKPEYVLFYLGINDVLKPRDRGDYDAKLDPSTWRAKSATWQFLRTLRANFTARSAQVAHGRMPRFADSDFTGTGLLALEQRQRLAADLTSSFVANLASLRDATQQYGAAPIFVTQTAFAWNGGAGPARGLNQRIEMHGHAMNFADISALHQAMNRGLLDYCRQTSTVCIDLAGEVVLDRDDYYDYVHQTPRGAAKVGRYLAGKLAALLPLPSAN